MPRSDEIISVDELDEQLGLTDEDKGMSKEEIAEKYPLIQPNGRLECPHCKVLLDHLMQYGKSWSKQCPSCNKSIPQKDIPPEFPVKQVEPKKAQKAATKYVPPQVAQTIGPEPPAPSPQIQQRVADACEQDDEVQERVERIRPPEAFGESTRRAPSGSPFKPVSDPTQALADILAYHHLKESFIDYVLRKAATKKEGMHPFELRSLLNDLDTGMKTKKQADYIVQDYVEALNRIKAEAEEEGRNVAMPDGFSPANSNMSGGQGLRGYEMPDGMEELADMMSASQPQQRVRGMMGQQNQQQGMTPEQVLKMFMQVQKQAEEKRKQDQLYEKVLRMESETPRMIQDAMNSMGDKLVAALGNNKKDDGPTIATVLAQMQADNLKTQMAMQQQMLNMQQAQIDKTMAELQAVSYTHLTLPTKRIV